EVVGHEDRRATSEEIDEMRSLVRQAMEDGAYGVSAGLFYRPAYYADTDEVIDVVSAAREWRTNFPHHIRNENNEVVEATAETIQIGEEAGLVPVITHMKVMGPDNWGKSAETVRLIEEAIDRGTYAAADVYPYLRSQTGLTAIVPPWAEEGGTSEMLKRFADPELRPIIEQEIIDIMHSRVESEADVYNFLFNDWSEFWVSEPLQHFRCPSLFCPRGNNRCQSCLTAKIWINICCRIRATINRFFN